MRICFLSSAHPPFDKRVFDKEAVSLAQNGFEVIHLAPDTSADQQMVSGVNVITYQCKNGIRGRILQLHRLFQFARDLRADVYHCNEVDSWFVGILLKAARTQTKIVFDVHEHYPSTFAESRFPKWLQPLIANLVRLVFRLLTPWTARLVLAKRTVASDFSGAEHKHVLVQNFTVLAADSEQLSADSKTAELNAEDKIVAIHLGYFSRPRGWPQLLDALASCKATNLHIHIIGTFNDGSQAEFEQKSRELGLCDRITVEGWMPFSDAYDRIKLADIGLVLFQPGIQNHVFALPHKMFDYMLAELPIIVPEFAEEVASIVEDSSCGICVDTSNSEQIAAALDKLSLDAQLRKMYGANGHEAVLNKYNWENEAKKLVNMYVELEEQLNNE